MTAPEKNVRAGSTPDQLRFEMLLTDVSARLLNMISNDINTEIDGALEEIREFFDSNMSDLFRINPEAVEVVLTHVHVTTDVPLFRGNSIMLLQIRGGAASSFAGRSS